MNKNPINWSNKPVVLGLPKYHKKEWNMSGAETNK